MTGPWQDWIPGVLSKSRLRQLCDNGCIIGAKSDPSFFDHSSLDLTLSDEGCHMLRGAIKPQHSFLDFLNSKKERALAQRVEFDSNGLLVLNRGKTYVFRLEQRLNTDLKESHFYGQATAKSSVGRLDVLARLIVDGMDRYEGFKASKIASGEMFVEVTPLTFDVRVKPGIALSQLRFFYGRAENVTIRGDELYDAVLPAEDPGQRAGERDGCLTLDLLPTPVGQTTGAAFRAKASKDLQPVSLWKATTRPDPKTYWDLISAEELGSTNRLPISKGAFYILRSKQKIALTRNVAVYCRATDETIGEMRIHYAGFVQSILWARAHRRPYWDFSHFRSQGT